MVAEATASSLFTGQASVAEFWASLPGFPTPRDMFQDCPRCLTIFPSLEGARPGFGYLGATHCTFMLPQEEVEELPATYPDARGIEQHGTETDSAFGREVPLYRFLDDAGNVRPIVDVGIRPYYAEEPFTRSPRLIRPKVGEAPIGPPSEFLTLWALLFCLSELARYYPDTWVGALDPDRSSAAVTLEHGLDLALERAPALISNALRGPLDALIREETKKMRNDVVPPVVEGLPGSGDPGAS
jgi:hypothetical protein